MKAPSVLITGGSGFIGTNLAHRILSEGRSVRIFDNLSRAGVERNMAWLQKCHGTSVSFEIGDIRDREAVKRAVRGVEQVFHFAAQVAVTTSLDDPQTDFDINAGGTLNLLQELRALKNPPSLVFTSTNKVYGGLEDIALTKKGDRYEPVCQETKQRGISEKRSLDFHSPYGCSKGCADQYVIDHARSYDMNTVVFRMSCIYGPHQFGTEDQGWVAHFLIKAQKGEPITLYGDGKQVRDILFVEDLVDAMLLAQANMPKLRGNAFNIGGGPDNTVSLLELIDLVKELQSKSPHLCFEDWRTGDQRYYVSDCSKFQEATGWKRRFGVTEGVKALDLWLRQESQKNATLGKVEMR